MKKAVSCILTLFPLLAVSGVAGCSSFAHNQAIPYYNKGVALSNKGKVDEAIAQYDKAIEIDQNYTKAYNNRGNAYLDKKQYDMAIADYNKAIALDPGFT